jgi:hypothetical protein
MCPSVTMSEAAAGVRVCAVSCGAARMCPSATVRVAAAGVCVLEHRVENKHSHDHTYTQPTGLRTGLCVLCHAGGAKGQTRCHVQQQTTDLVFFLCDAEVAAMGRFAVAVYCMGCGLDWRLCGGLGAVVLLRVCAHSLVDVAQLGVSYFGIPGCARKEGAHLFCSQTNRHDCEDLTAGPAAADSEGQRQALEVGSRQHSC